MTNAEKFINTFGLYASELRAMTEADFINWLTAESTNDTNDDEAT